MNITVKTILASNNTLVVSVAVRAEREMVVMVVRPGGSFGDVVGNRMVVLVLTAMVVLARVLVATLVIVVCVNYGKLRMVNDSCSCAHIRSYPHRTTLDSYRWRHRLPPHMCLHSDSQHQPVLCSYLKHQIYGIDRNTYMNSKHQHTILFDVSHSAVGNDIDLRGSHSHVLLYLGYIITIHT